MLNIFDQYGAMTIIYTRFAPILRTFAPFVAGAAEMNYARFFAYNIFGGIGWVAAMTLLGYTLGSVPFVRRNFDKVILLIIAISLAPAILEVWKSRTKARKPAVHKG